MMMSSENQLCIVKNKSITELGFDFDGDLFILSPTVSRLLKLSNILYRENGVSLTIDITY